MKNSLNVLKTLGVSFLTVLAGFLAMVIPFNLFDELSSRAMSFIFFGEITVYILLGFIFLVHKEISQRKKKAKKIKTQEEYIRKIKADDKRTYFNNAA